MNPWKSGWFYIVIILFLVVISGLIYHKCSVDSLKENNNKLLTQLLNDSNYQTKRLDETISGIKTIETKQISEDLIGEKLQEQLAKYNLEAVYGAQVQIQASLSKILEGQSGATTIIPRPVETPASPSTTTIIVRDDNHDNQSTDPSNSTCDIPGNDQPSTENVSVCNQCLASNIVRVPFDAQEGFLRVSGYTDSGPALGENGSYHLDVNWAKDIQLQIALTQAEDGTWNTLIDSNDPDVQVSRIRSELSVSPWETHWYERIKLGIGIGFGGEPGALINGAIGYQITDNFALLANWWYNMPFSGEIANYNDNALYGLLLIANL